MHKYIERKEHTEWSHGSDCFIYKTRGRQKGNRLAAIHTYYFSHSNYALKNSENKLKLDKTPAT